MVDMEPVTFHSATCCTKNIRSVIANMLVNVQKIYEEKSSLTISQITKSMKGTLPHYAPSMPS